MLFIISIYISVRRPIKVYTAARLWRIVHCYRPIVFLLCKNTCCYVIFVHDVELYRVKIDEIKIPQCGGGKLLIFVSFSPGRRAARNHVLRGRQLGHLNVADDDAYTAHARKVRTGPTVRRVGRKCRFRLLFVVFSVVCIRRDVHEKSSPDDCTIRVFHLRNTHTRVYIIIVMITSDSSCDRIRLAALLYPMRNSQGNLQTRCNNNIISALFGNSFVSLFLWPANGSRAAYI